MTKKTRTILFLFFLFVFFLTAPLVILYSQGYRFDFDNKKLTRTGGFFLKAEPKKVEIYIDGKLVKKTDFFSGSALVENLLPKKYKIEVKKEKYLSWEKKLEIKEKEVTEVKNLVLFPKNLNFNILIPHQKNGRKVIENFWFSPDEKKVILKESEDSKSGRTALSPLSPPLKEGEVSGWALKLYDLERDIKSHLISENEIYQKEADLLNLEFSENSKELYLDIGLKKQEKKFVLKLDKVPVQFLEKKIAPSPENILVSQKQNQDFYYLDNSGYVFKNEQKLNEIPFLVQPETKYSLKIFQEFIFLQEGENLYLFSPNSKSFEKFFEKIKELKISPDNKKMVFFSSSEIWILFLKDERAKKAGEKLFITRLSEKIDNVFWLNSDYLIFNSGNNLKIAEIDDRDRIQTWDIANFPNPKIHFNQSNRKLYILSQENLFVSEKIF